MRMLAAVAAVASLAVVAAQAGADAAVPVPPVPPVTVPTVTVSVPTVPTVPALPVPPVLPNVSTATAPVGVSTPNTTKAVPTALGSIPAAPSLSGGGSTSSSSSSSSSPSSSSSTAYSGRASSTGGADAAGAQGPTVMHFNSNRPWIGTTGSKKRRTTTFTFVLPARARVIFMINQLWPVCRGAGRFSVLGHAGVNRVRFAGRVHGRQLTPGTYRVSARTARGRVVQRVVLVIVSGSAPTPEQLTAARAANVCKSGGAAAAAATSAPSTGASATNLAGATSVEPVSASDQQQDVESVSAGPFPAKPNVDSGVLGTSVEETVRTIRPLLVALLAAAIVLLGLASVPPAAVGDRRVNDVLARHRLEIAGIGAAALVATAVAFLLV